MLARVQSRLGALPLAEIGAAVLLAAPVAWLLRRRVSPRTVGAVAGMVALYALIGLVRGQFGEAQATRSRYLYEGVILVILATSGLLGDRLRPGVARLDRPSTAALAAFLTTLLVLGLANNAAWLVAGRQDWTSRSNEARAYIALLDEIPDAAFAPPAEVAWNIPDPDRMRRLIAAHGSPARDALLPGVVRTPSELDRDRALFRLVGGAFVVGDGPGAGSPVPIRVVAVEGAVATIEGSCVTVEPVEPDGARLTLEVPDGGAIELEAAASTTGSAALHRAPTPQAANAIDVAIGPDPVTLRTPLVGSGDAWLVSLDVPASAGPVVACPLDAA
jgi:hypothetical protein